MEALTFSRFVSEEEAYEHRRPRKTLPGSLFCGSTPTKRWKDRGNRWETRLKEERSSGLVLQSTTKTETNEIRSDTETHELRHRGQYATSGDGGYDGPSRTFSTSDAGPVVVCLPCPSYPSKIAWSIPLPTGGDSRPHRIMARASRGTVDRACRGGSSLVPRIPVTSVLPVAQWCSWYQLVNILVNILVNKYNEFQSECNSRT